MRADKHNIQKVAWLVPTVLLLGWFAIHFSEWFHVQVVANPHDLAQYPFGTEGPIGDNPKYRSIETYGQAMLRTWIICVALAVIFVVGGLKKWARSIYVGYFALAIFIGAEIANAL